MKWLASLKSSQNISELVDNTMYPAEEVLVDLAIKSGSFMTTLESYGTRVD